MPLALLSLLSLAMQSLAETVYVRDTLYVPLRGGESAEHRILHRGIRSGTPLELISNNESSGYSLVRMEDGMEGYIQSQYLVPEPIARDHLDSTRSQLLEAEGNYQKTLLRVQELDDSRQLLQEQVNSLRADNAQLKQELDEIKQLAANVIEIDEENKAITQERANLTNEIEALSIANQNLENTSNQQWFLRGAGVVLVGLLFGFWLARRIYHKRSTGGWS